MLAPSLSPALPPTPDQRYLAERYFRLPPLEKDKNLAIALLDVGATAFTISALMLALGGSGAFLIGVVIGLLMLFVGWFRLEEYGRQFTWAEQKATDAAMDARLSQQLSNIEQDAMNQLAITPADLDGTAGGAVEFHPWQGGPYLPPPNHQGPFTVFGPMLEPKIHRIGNDDVWRFRSYEVLVLCPTRRCMGIYECVLNTATGKRSKIELREYDYSDIVVMSLVDRPTNLGLGWQIIQGVPRFAGGKARLRELQIVVASGDHSKIVAGIDFPLSAGGWVRLQPSRLGNFVQCTRHLLRTKRRTG
jgi:hypothetical protein